MVAHRRQRARDFDRKTRRLRGLGMAGQNANAAVAAASISTAHGGCKPNLKTYLHWVGAYLANRVPAAAAPRPWLVAVCFEREVQAQSILPARPVASTTPPMNGLSFTVCPLICGVAAA